MVDTSQLNVAVSIRPFAENVLLVYFHTFEFSSQLH